MSKHFFSVSPAKSKHRGKSSHSKSSSSSSHSCTAIVPPVDPGWGGSGL
jgi:hypothetical protein